MATALERRWSFDDIDLTSSPALLSALDPRFRGLKFLSDCDKESMKAYLLQLLEKDSDQSQTQEKEKRDDRAPPVKKTALDVLLGEEEMQCEEDQGVAVEEIAQYFAERPVARETKPLVWWKMNCYRFPRIAELARSTLVPATSTPSERLFSKAGQTISKRRNSLKVAGTLINMHNIHNLWSPQKCASVNAVQTGLCVELRHLLNQLADEKPREIVAAAIHMAHSEDQPTVLRDLTNRSFQTKTQLQIFQAFR